MDKVPGLWVLELGPHGDESWLHHVEEITETLIAHERLLVSLAQGSEDYTLHLAVRFTDPLNKLELPPELIKIAGKVGFGIEVVPME